MTDTHETFDPVGDFEALSDKMALTIMMNGWPIVRDIDRAFGCARVKDETKAVWLTTGQRVTVTFSRHGALIIAVSRTRDPIYDERKAVK